MLFQKSFIQAMLKGYDFVFYSVFSILILFFNAACFGSMELK